MTEQGNIIQKNDILHIKISSLNPEASSSFNTNVPGNSDDLVAGHLVSTDGTIQLPFLGLIQAEGKTKDQLREIIIQRILELKLLKDPVVVVRFMNFRVTVLGEVNHPSVVNVPNEKITLLEAIGLAGDITIYGKKDNVLVIREENNKRITQRINLNSNEIFTSPYYYLKSGDIVYVEPSKARVASAGRSNQWLPMLFSGLSLVAIVADRVLN